jgi:hypothetical protein
VLAMFVAGQARRERPVLAPHAGERVLAAVQIRDYPATNKSSDGENDKGPAKAPCHWM